MNGLTFSSENDFTSCFIDLHYRFSDQSHIMDAIVQNKCEIEFLRLITAAAKTCKIQITIEIEPHLEGGLINRYKITQKKAGKKKGGIPASIKTALLTAVFLAPTTIVVNGINEIVKNIVSKNYKDDEKENLEKEKLRLEIEKLQIEIKAKQEISNNQGIDKTIEKQITAFAIQDFRESLIKLNNNLYAAKRRIKFYENLAHYDKVTSVSTQLVNAGYLYQTPEFQVEKNEFIALASDVSETLRKIDLLSELIGADSPHVLKLKNQITRKLNARNNTNQ